MHVQYLTGDDKKIYFVIERVGDEVRIAIDVPFYKNIIRQLPIWQSISLFRIIE